MLSAYKNEQIGIAIDMHKAVYGYEPIHIDFQFWSCSEIEDLISELGCIMRIRQSAFSRSEAS